MTQKHTPWHKGFYNGHGWNICQSDNGRVVAHVNSHDEFDDADAILIAAAPETAAERDRLREINAELIAALEGLFEHCAMVHKHWGEESNSKEANAAQAAAHAAIAKAKEQ